MRIFLIGQGNRIESVMRQRRTVQDEKEADGLYYGGKIPRAKTALKLML